MNYPEIEKLFGSPLHEVPIPRLPFLSPKSKKVVITVGIVLAAFGVYAIIKGVKSYFEESNKGKK